MDMQVVLQVNMQVVLQEGIFSQLTWKADKETKK
jgi:hypothetical protein